MTMLPSANLLPPRPPGGRRSLGLGLLLGLLLAASWLQQRHQVLLALQQRESQLRAEHAPLALALAQAQAQALQEAQAQQAQAQAQALRARLLQGLSVLEDLAQAQGARLSLVRLDAQGLTVHGQMPLSDLPAWTQSRAWPGSGLGPPQLLELSALAQDQGAGTGGLVRFVVRWPTAQGVTP